VLVSADLGLACIAPWRPAPCPGSLCFPGFPLQASWRSDLGPMVALLAKHADLASLDGRPFALALAGGCAPALLLMQAPEWRKDGRCDWGSQPNYQLRFFAPGPGQSARIRHRLSPCPGGPVVGAPNGQRARWWAGRRSSQGGGMLWRTASSGMIQLTGSAIMGWVVPDKLAAPAGVDPPNGGGAFQAAEASFYWRSVLGVCAHWVCGLLPIVLALRRQFPTPRP